MASLFSTDNLANETNWEFWKKHIGAQPTGVPFPSDRPRDSPGSSHKLAVVSFPIPVDDISSLESQTKRHGTAADGLLVLFQLLLHRYTPDSSDVFVQYPVEGLKARHTSQAQMFELNKPVVYRTSFKDEKTTKWSDHLAASLKTLASVKTYSKVPLSTLIPRFRVRKDRRVANPFRQFMFSVAQSNELLFNEAHGTWRFIIAGQDGAPVVPLTQYEIALVLTIDRDSAYGVLFYRPDLFDKSSMQNLGAAFVSLLHAAVKKPGEKLDRLPVLSTDQLQRMLVTWNTTSLPFAKDRSVNAFFEAQSKRFGSKPAFLGTGLDLTYDDVLSMSAKLAQHLVSEHSLKPGMHVGVLMSFAGSEYALVVLALLRAGCVYVPLSLEDPVDRASVILLDCGINIVITLEQYATYFASVPANTTKVLSVDAILPKLDALAPLPIAPKVSLNSLAAIIYVSGGNGKPVGVCLSHSNLLRIALDLQNFVSFLPEDRVAQLCDVSEPTSLFEFWGAILNGCVLVPIPRNTIEASPDNFAAILKQRRVTTAFINQHRFETIADAAPWAFSGMQNVLFDGHRVDSSIVVEILRNGPPKRLAHVYAPAEVPGFALYHDVDQAALLKAQADMEATQTTAGGDSGTALDAAPIPLGRPCTNVAAYILDRHMQPVPVGVPGELFLGGQGLAPSYWKQPKLVEAKMLTNPFHRGSLLNTLTRADPVSGTALITTPVIFKTGNVCKYRSDGNVEYLYRKENRATIKGRDFSLTEVEAVLSTHQGVRKAAVVVVRDQQLGQTLHAYVVPNPKRPPAFRDLTAHLQERLPAYMIPHQFVMRDSLATDASGEIDRGTLRATVAMRKENGISMMPPRNAVEERLAGIFTQCMGLEEVGVYDNFLQLGGDSITGVRVINKARQAGFKLSLQQLFEHQSVAGLAKVAGTGNDVIAEQRTVIGDYPLTPAQRWFIAQPIGDHNHWNNSAVVKLRPDVTIPVLERLLRAMVLHHDGLRTKIVKYRGGAVHNDASLSRRHNGKTSSVSNPVSADASPALGVRGASGKSAAGAGPSASSKSAASASAFDFVAQYTASLSPAPIEVKIQQFNLSKLNKTKQNTQMVEKASELQRSLNIRAGPLYAFAVFQLDRAGDDRVLLIVLHQLVVDVRSWQVLFEDLDMGYAQLAQGGVVELPPKTVSLLQWSEYLNSKARDAAVLRQMPLWLKSMRQVTLPKLPCDYAGGVNSLASERSNHINFSTEETRFLLSVLPKTYYCTTQQIVIAALWAAVIEWTGHSDMYFSIFSNQGRDSIKDDYRTDFGPERGHRNASPGGSSGKRHGSRRAGSARAGGSSGHRRTGSSRRANAMPDLGADFSVAMDVSRTVGWFPAVAPVLLRSNVRRKARAAGQASKEDIIQRTRDQLVLVKELTKDLHQRAMQFSLLRWLAETEAQANALAEAYPTPELSISWLGDVCRTPSLSLGHVMRPWPASSNAHMNVGEDKTKLGYRSHLIDMLAYVDDGHLNLHSSYSDNMFKTQTIEQLMQGVASSLRGLVDLARKHEPGMYTPSDFPLVKVDQAALNRLKEQGITVVESIYPLSRVQDSFMRTQMRDPESKYSGRHLAMTLAGEIDIKNLRQACVNVLDRFPVLRTSFVHQGVSEPLQIVTVSRDEFPNWEEKDFTSQRLAKHPEQIDREVDNFLKSKVGFGFDLSPDKPFFVYTLLRFSKTSNVLVLTFTSMVMDVWSVPIMTKEVLRQYTLLQNQLGAPASSLVSPPFGDYVRWERRRAMTPEALASAKRWWHAYMRNFRGKVSLASLEHTDAAADHKGWDEQQVRLGVAMTTKLYKVAQLFQVTFNTLVQGAWAILLARLSGSTDVVYGNSLNCRNPDLGHGSEWMIGPLTNVLPMRVSVTDSQDVYLYSWLKDLQRTQMDLLIRSHHTIPNVLEWSNTGARHEFDLYDSVFSFATYPQDILPLWDRGFGTFHFQLGWDPGFEVKKVRFLERQYYPLLVVPIPGPELTLRAVYSCSRFSTAFIIRLMRDYKSLLEHMADAHDRPLSAFAAGVGQTNASPRAGPGPVGKLISQRSGGGRSGLLSGGSKGSARGSTAKLVPGATTIRKQGFLTKRGGLRKNWKRRWFVLDDANIYYFATSQASTPLGVIPLRDISRKVQPVSMDKFVRPFIFEIPTSNRIYYCQAGSTLEREGWVTAIMSVKNK